MSAAAVNRPAIYTRQRAEDVLSQNSISRARKSDEKQYNTAKCPKPTGPHIRGDWGQKQAREEREGDNKEMTQGAVSQPGSKSRLQQCYSYKYVSKETKQSLGFTGEG